MDPIPRGSLRFAVPVLAVGDAQLDLAVSAHGSAPSSTGRSGALSERGADPRRGVHRRPRLLPLAVRASRGARHTWASSAWLRRPARRRCRDGPHERGPGHLAATPGAAGAVAPPPPRSAWGIPRSWRTFPNAVAFVLGFGVVFTVFGTTSTWPRGPCATTCRSCARSAASCSSSSA